MTASYSSPSSQGEASCQISPSRYRSGLRALSRARSLRRKAWEISLPTSKRMASMSYRRTQFSHRVMKYSWTSGSLVLSLGIPPWKAKEKYRPSRVSPSVKGH